MTPIRRLTDVSRATFAIGQQFQHLGQHLGAVGPVQRQRQLRDQHTVALPEIVAAAVVFQRQVLLVARQLGQRGGERAGAGVEQVHHARREHVHAEEAEIIAGAHAGDQEALFGFGGGGLFDDGLDAVEVAAAGDASAGDRAETRQQALAGRLHAADGAGFGLGQFHQALGTAGFGWWRRRDDRPPCAGRRRRR